MSKYVRKTTTEWQLYADYGYGFEELHAEETHKEIRARLREYRENEPGVPFRIKLARVRIAENVARVDGSASTMPMRTGCGCCGDSGAMSWE